MKLLGHLVSQAVIVCVTLCWCWISGIRLLLACMCLYDCRCSCPNLLSTQPTPLSHFFFFLIFNFMRLPFCFANPQESLVYIFFSVWMCNFDQHWYPNLFSVCNSDHKECQVYIVFKRTPPPPFANMRVIYCFLLSTGFTISSSYKNKNSIWFPF